MSHALNPYPSDYRTAFASSAIPYPSPHRLALRLAFPCGRTTGLPRSVTHAAGRVRPCLSAGGHSVRGRAAVSPCTGPLTFWFEPSPRGQHLRLVSIDDVYRQFVFLAIPSDPAPDHLGAGSRALASRLTRQLRC